jgi:Kef-type K+ transport system membrane component KefB
MRPALGPPSPATSTKRPARTRFRVALLTAAGLVLATRAAHADTVPHGFDILPVLEGLVLMILGGKLGGSAFAAIKQSPVLGELLVGIVLGNLGLVGFHGLDAIRDMPSIDLLAQIGVLFLLFSVGLSTDVGKMIAVGASSFVVATLGVIAPMVLGYFCSAWFFPSHHPMTHWFVGATLCATSVGITARVLSDLGRVASVEGRIILGAAVIDDVLGLIVLAVIAGIIRAADSGSAFHATSVVWILVKSVGFLAGAVVIGRWLAPRTFALAARAPGESLLLPVALAFCFGFAYLAGRVGLAPIVGAFAAGLVLEDAHYRDLRARDERRRDLQELLEPIASFLVPVFFVLMGMRVDLSVFGRPAILGFAAVLTLAAVVGKQVCGLGVFEKGADRIAIGLGMIPRGEVGLILAGIGSTLMLRGERVIDDAVFSAVVVMVGLTTLLTPPLLTARMRGRAALEPVEEAT